MALGEIEHQYAVRGAAKAYRMVAAKALRDKHDLLNLIVDDLRGIAEKTGNWHTREILLVCADKYEKWG
jgi:hypothetical protein